MVLDLEAAVWRSVLDASPIAPKPRRWASPLAMAAELDNTVVRTPALNLIDRALVDVAEGREDRLIVSMPPQEAKSTTISRWYPEWLLSEVDPDLRIIMISYSDEIARRWGADVKRDFESFNGDEESIDLGVRLRADSRAAGRWQVEGRRGGMFCAGVAGSVTGRPADCLSGPTRVVTSWGMVPIRDLHEAAGPIPLVLSFNHDTGRTQWRPIVATRAIPDRPLAELVTAAGRRIACTPDHRIHVAGRGYLPAGELRPGDILQAPDAQGDAVTEVRDLPTRDVVYDLQVDGPSNFFAEGVLVHNCILIDDPIKDLEQAQSSIYRERFQRFWQGVAVPRLGPGARVVLVSCMTGDTPVLLPDGTEKSLRDIRPGDEVATYEGGGFATSTVMNWANQGPDDLFRIRMKSGRVVRANARHPFLTIDANRKETWLRTDQIRPGLSILTAIGGSGAEPPAPLANATCRRAARECATPTTTRPVGHPDIGRPRSMLRRVVELASSIATGSPMKRLTFSSMSRAGTAPSADNHHRTPTLEPTGTANCASTTTTTPGKSEGYSATTATSLSDTESRPPSSGQPLTTWSVTPDEVVAVEPCGREDVFDLQIVRTANFIANGLVSHNTRWHEEDAAGWLIQTEGRRDRGGRWKVINIPAIAEDENDPLGRKPGEPMISARGNRDWAGIRKSVGEYVWASLYQGRPAPAEGGLFRRLWWRYWSPAPQLGMTSPRLDLGGRVINLGDCWRYLSGDLAASTRTSADFTVAAAWALSVDGDLILLDYNRARVGEAHHFDLFRPLAQRWNVDTVFLEASQYATTLVAEATRSGLHITPVQAETDKFSRALPYSARCSGGRLWLPAGSPKVQAWVDEHAAFNAGRHDDMVDTGSLATRVAVTRWAPSVGPPQRPSGPPEPDYMSMPM